MSNRRGFLRALVGEVVKGAQEIAPTLNLPPDLLGAEQAPPPAPERTPDRLVRRTHRAVSTQRQIFVDELVALAEQTGLANRLDAVRSLARRSVRLVHGDADPRARSRLGGTPDLPRGVEWPEHAGARLPFLTQIDLAEIPEGVDDLPERGLLSIFCATGDDADDTRPLPAGAVRVLWSGEEERAPAPHAQSPVLARAAVPASGEATTPGRAIRLSPELTLPRGWSKAVEAYELDEEEQGAWRDLREHLAELQEVPLADVTDRAYELTAIHRLLGYPDERRGIMPLLCELTARGAELGDTPAIRHPEAERAQADAGRWRLLLQLTVDDELGWSWGESRKRLFLWIDEQDLRALDFSRVMAIVQ